MACTLNGGYDSNGQVYGLQIQKQDTNSPLLFMKRQSLNFELLLRNDHL
jgi:hypothetical protein